MTFSLLGKYRDTASLPAAFCAKSGAYPEVCNTAIGLVKKSLDRATFLPILQDLCAFLIEEFLARPLGALSISLTIFSGYLPLSLIIVREGRAIVSLFFLPLHPSPRARTSPHAFETLSGVQTQ